MGHTSNTWLKPAASFSMTLFVRIDWVLFLLSTSLSLFQELSCLPEYTLLLV